MTNKAQCSKAGEDAVACQRQPTSRSLAVHRSRYVSRPMNKSWWRCSRTPGEADKQGWEFVLSLFTLTLKIAHNKEWLHVSDLLSSLFIKEWPWANRSLKKSNCKWIALYKRVTMSKSLSMTRERREQFTLFPVRIALCSFAQKTDEWIFNPADKPAAGSPYIKKKSMPWAADKIKPSWAIRGWWKQIGDFAVDQGKT